MFVGLLTSIICTPDSSSDVTIAYVAVLFDATVNVSTPVASSSLVNPFAPSVSVSVTTMFVGSLTS